MFRLVLLAATVVVSVTVSGFSKVNQVPTQYSTIQTGINNSHNGDTVLVAPGTYFENLNFRGKRIVLASRFIIDKSLNTIRQTIIDGSRPSHPDSASVVIFGSGEDSSTTLMGFSLTNGVGTLVPGSFVGGGILVTAGSSPRITYNIIHHNSAVRGGGIGVQYGFPIITHNAIVSNNAGNGGGISVELTWAKIFHNVFYANSADINGGALIINNAFVDFNTNAVVNNSAAAGGSIFCQDGLWSIQNCDFWGNLTTAFAGCGATGLGELQGKQNQNLDSVDSYGNMFTLPRFVDPLSLDFNLQCSSRLIDAGTNLPDNYPMGGPREDIGMFEFPYRVGDLTFDNRVNLADATALVNIIFLGAPIPCPMYAADTDCSRSINIVDVVALLNYWIGSGDTPCLFDKH